MFPRSARGATIEGKFIQVYEIAYIAIHVGYINGPVHASHLTIVAMLYIGIDSAAERKEREQQVADDLLQQQQLREPPYTRERAPFPAFLYRHK